MRKQKTFKYPMFAKILDKNNEVCINIVTQLYQTGVYIAEYYKGNSMPNQFGLTPAQMKRYLKTFAPGNLQPGYKSEFGPEITVIENNGLFERVI